MWLKQHHFVQDLEEQVQGKRPPKGTWTTWKTMLCSPGESLIPAFMRQTKLTSGEQQQQQEEEQQQQQRLQGHVKSSLSWWFTVPTFINPNLDPNW